MHWSHRALMEQLAGAVGDPLSRRIQGGPEKKGQLWDFYKYLTYIYKSISVQFDIFYEEKKILLKSRCLFPNDTLGRKHV